jgi:hypothetical protein
MHSLPQTVFLKVGQKVTKIGLISFPGLLRYNKTDKLDPKDVDS